jgi:hypothetical protein
MYKTIKSKNQISNTIKSKTKMSEIQSVRNPKCPKSKVSENQNVRKIKYETENASN